MGAVVVVAGAVFVLAALLVAGRWRNADEVLPQFVMDGSCPECHHGIEQHRLTSRLSRVREGCEIPGCTCTTPIIRPPAPA